MRPARSSPSNTDNGEWDEWMNRGREGDKEGTVRGNSPSNQASWGKGSVFWGSPITKKEGGREGVEGEVGENNVRPGGKSEERKEESTRKGKEEGKEDFIKDSLKSDPTSSWGKGGVFWGRPTSPSVRREVGFRMGGGDKDVNFDNEGGVRSASPPMNETMTSSSPLRGWGKGSVRWGNMSSKEKLVGKDDALKKASAKVSIKKSPIALTRVSLDTSDVEKVQVIITYI